MEETIFVRVSHGREAHFVALYKGLNPAEVSRLLQAAFKLPRAQHVVGLIDRANPSGPGHEHGFVVPLTLACRAPQILGDRSYSLLLSDKKIVWERPSTSTSRLTSARGPITGADGHNVCTGAGQALPGPGLFGRTRGNAGVRRKPAGRTLWGDEDDDEEEVEEGAEDEETGENLMGRIVAFIRQMAFDGLLTKDDQSALESSAVAGDVVINAAFSVALHSQDLDYLSALFKDIASNKRDSSQGTRLLEAKREMLDVAEALQQADEVDNQQLVYLQNLILVSNHAINKAFGAYEEDHDPVRLAETLKQLCGAEAQSHSTTEAVVSDDTDCEKSGIRDQDHPIDEADRGDMKATVLAVIMNLSKKGLLGARETNMANDMVLRENPVLIAAFKLFQEDGNAAELQDTVARAVRFEAKRGEETSMVKGGQVPAASPAKNSPPRQTPVPKPNAIVANPVGRGAAVENVDNRSLKGGWHVRSTTSSEPSGVEVEEKGVVGDVCEAAALEGFEGLVTLAVQKGMMSMSDARVICSAFESGLGGESGRLQDVVHAAWGLYSTGGGQDDALDSLVRIVRLVVKPLQSAKVSRVKARPLLRPSGRDTVSDARGRSASSSTAALRESMSAAVNAIATQSAHILLESKKVSAEEAACLASPSLSGCHAILKALEMFEGGSNRDELLDALAATAKAEFARHQTERRQGGDTEQGEADEEQGQGEEQGDGNHRDGEEDENDDQEQSREQSSSRGVEDTGEGFSSDRATVELMELAECMAEDNRIGVEEASELTKLIENKHPVVMLAYKNYAATQDVSELVGSLTSILRMKTPASASCTAFKVDRATTDRGGTGDPDTTECQHTPERIVRAMNEARVLTAVDAARVLLLLARKDPETMAAFGVFGSSKNVSSLVKTIKSILQADYSTAAEDNDRETRIEVDPEQKRVDKDAAGDAIGGAESPNDNLVAENVVSIVESMRLDERETAALRLAIGRGDANIRGALELFRLDPDADELKDTIARVARLILEREREGGSAEPVTSSEASAVILASSRESSGISSASANNASATDAVDLTLDDKMGLFQELLQQLRCVGMISEAQAAVIMDRYQDKDAVVFAALDVYKNENDMSELVDTLKRLT